MRLFLAIDPDAAARQALTREMARLRRRLGAEAERWRWVDADLVHVTLHFLGNVDDANETRLRHALGFTIPRPPFEIATSGLGTFPPRRPPEALWLGLGPGAEALGDVHRDLAEALTTTGLPVESRPFAPHLTLARARRGARATAPPPDDAPAIRWRVDRVTLYASDLSGPAPRYTARHVVRLADAP